MKCEREIRETIEFFGADRACRKVLSIAQNADNKVDVLEFQLAQALCALNAISTKTSDDELVKFCKTHILESGFEWKDKLKSVGAI